MAEIIVRTDAAKLQEFASTLRSIQSKMVQDSENLGNAYQRATWDDMVSEKARVQLNDYIRNLNKSLDQLGGVIYAVDQLQNYAAQYESME